MGYTIFETLDNLNRNSSFIEHLRLCYTNSTSVCWNFKSSIGQPSTQQGQMDTMGKIVAKIISYKVCGSSFSGHLSPQVWPQPGGFFMPIHDPKRKHDVAEKFNRQWKGLDENFQIKFKNLTSESPVTSQVRSSTKCSTFFIYCISSAKFRK